VNFSCFLSLSFPLEIEKENGRKEESMTRENAIQEFDVVPEGNITNTVMASLPAGRL
jgi:hypothetical protein